jgi:hypothetical protein
VSAGFFTLDRDLLEHPIWVSRGPFSDGQCWVDLIGLANHHNSNVRVGGTLLEVKRGQVFTSQLTLSKRWGHDRKWVRRFLDALEIDGMCLIQTSRQSHTGYTLLTLCNYNARQLAGENGRPIQRPTQRDTDAPITPQSRPTSKKVKKGKKTTTSSETRSRTAGQDDSAVQDDIPPTFLAQLHGNPAFRGLDVAAELGRMDAWLAAHPRRRKTRRFVVGWLNRESRQPAKPKPPDPLAGKTEWTS